MPRRFLAKPTWIDYFVLGSTPYIALDDVRREDNGWLAFALSCPGLLFSSAQAFWLLSLAGCTTTTVARVARNSFVGNKKYIFSFSSFFIYLLTLSLPSLHLFVSRFPRLSQGP